MTTTGKPPTRPVRWGIVGTGGIAAAFATDLALLPSTELPGAEIVAVGSRSTAAAQAFGERFGIARRHASYADLVADDEVEAVYVATPHPHHRECALAAIAAGKAVLVEKPFTLNAMEAREVVAAARARGTFLMEAMWSRFLPHMAAVRSVIAAGSIGDVRSLQADFCELFPPDPQHRAYAPELGGGALLDLGVYPVSLASMVFGRPTRIAALSQPAFTGVDAQTGVVLAHESGALAVLLSSFECTTGNTASISGSLGRIEIEGDFLAPSRFWLITPDGGRQLYDFPHEGRGLRHQALEVGRCLRAGETESSILPLDETLSIMETLDAIRAQIGLSYPSELAVVGTG